jgi:hypothetical protein
MKRIFAANIVGIGAVLALGVAASANAAQAPQGIVHAVSTTTSSPSVSPSTSPSPTVTVTESPSPSPTPTVPTDEPTGVTADIHVELDFPDSDGPMVFEINGAPVNDGVELENQDPISNPSDYCGDIAVDIASDLSGVLVTGGDNPCNFQEAYVGIVLHGAEWGPLSSFEDGLFVPNDEQEGPAAFFGESFGGAGKGSLSAALHTAITEVPSLQGTNIDGSLFEAYWSGTDDADMDGATLFVFDQAPGAEPVPGDPTFTG